MSAVGGRERGRGHGRGRGWRLARLRRRLGDDRGSLTVAVVLWTPVFLLLAAFVVDMGFLISQRDRAGDLADQAARRVADDLDPAALRSSTYIVETDSDGRHCLTDARNYLASSGVDPATAVVSDCTVDPATGAGAGNPANVTVNVTVLLTYKPLFAGLVLTGPITVTGHGTAHPVVG